MKAGNSSLEEQTGQHQPLSISAPPVAYDEYRVALERQGTSQARPQDEVILSHGVSRGISYAPHLNALEDSHALEPY